ncbi:MAG: hypothetical protein KZQ76_14515 [Candidatus Thiodiazotropha sp. (ex Epidulcina cf. delphinae)]|nr:hypothetical protein [Candidatus Thiodiazotropha sp. (ex Epidulcina cf. delphinae)]
MKFISVVFFIFAVFSLQANAATYLYLYSQPDDHLGQGKEQTWLEQDGSFSASGNHDNGVSLAFAGATAQWYLDFAASNKEPLTPGSYPDAAHAPSTPLSQHKLNVYESNRYCNEANGRFDVLEAAYDINGAVIRFAAYFEVHCEGADDALFGAVRYNSGNQPRIRPPSAKDSRCAAAPTAAACGNQGVQGLLGHDKAKVALLRKKNARRLLNRSLEQDRADIVMTLNEDFGATIVSVHDGKRLEPCLVEGAEPSKHPAHLKPCGPDIDKGKLLHEETYRVSVREGSRCFYITVNGYEYKFCIPSK